MLQALQIMFLTVIISAVVGFLISLLIFLLTKFVNRGKKKRDQEKELQEKEIELALAVAVAFAGKQPR